jgi:hypothetical protein
MPRPIESIINRLVTRGVGVFGTTIFAGTGADLPNTGTIVTVSETGGQAPIRTHNSGSVKQPTFQIIARSASYLSAAAKIDECYNALGGSDALPIKNMTINGFFWLWIIPTSEPLILPVDANSRSRLTFNVEGVWRG